MTDTSGHPACWPVESLLQQCEVKRTRGSGPGGQHRNKVETAIVITHQPTGITGKASERRSQAANYDQAVNRLRINLALGFRSPDNPASANRGRELWNSRVRSGKINISTQHEDFPAMLAVALDALENRDFDASQAAADLDCSTSQLVKLLKKQRAGLELVNRRRREQGLPVYR